MKEETGSHRFIRLVNSQWIDVKSILSISDLMRVEGENELFYKIWLKGHHEVLVIAHKFWVPENGLSLGTSLDNLQSIMQGEINALAAYKNELQ